MKKVSIILFCLCAILSASAQKSSVDSVVENSIKTEIFEKDSTVYIKSLQVTTTAITAERIAQEIEKLNQQTQQITAQKKQLDEQSAQIQAQIKEFERLLGGVIVTEKRIKDKSKTVKN